MTLHLKLFIYTTNIHFSIKITLKISIHIHDAVSILFTKGSAHMAIHFHIIVTNSNTNSL